MSENKNDKPHHVYVKAWHVWANHWYHKKCEKMRNNNMDNTKKPNLEGKSSDSAEKKTSDDIGAKKPKQNESDDKNSKDCRDHCMHCGNHCIYLNND